MNQIVLTKPKIEVDNKKNVVEISNGENVDIKYYLNLQRRGVYIGKLVLSNCKKVVIPDDMVIDRIVVRGNGCEIICNGIVKNIVIDGVGNTIELDTRTVLGQEYNYVWFMDSITIIGSNNKINDISSSIPFVKKVNIFGSENRIFLQFSNIGFVNFEGASKTYLLCNRVVASKHDTYNTGLISSINFPFLSESTLDSNNNVIVSPKDPEYFPYGSELTRQYMVRVPSILSCLKHFLANLPFRTNDITKVKSLEELFKKTDENLKKFVKYIEENTDHFEKDYFENGKIMVIRYNSNYIIFLRELVDSLNDVPKKDIKTALEIAQKLESQGYNPNQRIIVVAPVRYFETRILNINNRQIELILCPLDELGLFVLLGIRIENS